MLSTMIVFLIAGLWHGPSWLYVIFGAMHGTGLIINHIYRRFINFPLNIFFSRILTFFYINFAFVFFRSENIENVLMILKKMFLIDVLNNYEMLSINISSQSYGSYFFYYHLLFS